MENCIFCKIAAGKIPSQTVYEDETFRVILDLNQAMKGHMLILPKAHYENFYELPDEIAAEAMVLAKKLSLAAKKAFAEAGTPLDGLNILQNNGEAAGQSVMHYHLHVLPRIQGDDPLFPQWSEAAMESGNMKELAEKLKGALS